MLQLLILNPNEFQILYQLQSDSNQVESNYSRHFESIQESNGGSGTIQSASGIKNDIPNDNIRPSDNIDQVDVVKRTQSPLDSKRRDSQTEGDINRVSTNRHSRRDSKRDSKLDGYSTKRTLHEFQSLLLLIKHEFPQYLIYKDDLQEFINYFNLVDKDCRILNSELFQQFLKSEFRFEYKPIKKRSSVVEIDEFFNLEQERSLKLVQLLNDAAKELTRIIAKRVGLNFEIVGVENLLSIIENNLKLELYKLEAFNHRLNLLSLYSKQVQKTKTLIDKVSMLKQTSNIASDKVERLLSELQEEKSREMECKNEFYNASSCLRSSLKRVREEQQREIGMGLDELVEKNWK